jgi:hypothetical protein
MAFRPGDRVELVATDDPSTRLRPGDRGTVTGFGTPEPTIDVHWDNDSTLTILPEAGDRISKLPVTTPAATPIQHPDRQPQPTDLADRHPS